MTPVPLALTCRMRYTTSLPLPHFLRGSRLLFALSEGLRNLPPEFVPFWTVVKPMLFCSFLLVTGLTLTYVRPANIKKPFLRPSSFPEDLSGHITMLFGPILPHFLPQECEWFCTSHPTDAWDHMYSVGWESCPGRSPYVGSCSVSNMASTQTAGCQATTPLKKGTSRRKRALESTVRARSSSIFSQRWWKRCLLARTASCFTQGNWPQPTIPHEDIFHRKEDRRPFSWTAQGNWRRNGLAFRVSCSPRVCCQRWCWRASRERVRGCHTSIMFSAVFDRCLLVCCAGCANGCGKNVD